MSQVSEYAGTTVPNTPEPSDQDIRRYVFGYLIPSNEAASTAISRTREKYEDCLKHITNIDYRGNPSTPCFEVALNNLSEHPHIGWSIGRGRDGYHVDFRLDTSDDSIAGVHARFSFVKGATGFFLFNYNRRSKLCTINGQDISICGDKRHIPTHNTILIGNCAFTFRYVERKPGEQDLFQLELNKFFAEFLNDDNPIILPTPREACPRLGRWTIQCAIGRDTFGIAYQVIHDDGTEAVAKQLLKTSSNRYKIDRKIRVANSVSELKDVQRQWIAVPFETMHVVNRTQVDIDRIKSIWDQNGNPGDQSNIIDEYVIFSPLFHATLHTVVEGDFPTSSRAIFFAKLLSAVAFLHDNGICHNDIKPNNILVRSYDPPSPLLSEFGSASGPSDVLYDWPRTVPYLAPERDAAGETRGFKADCWACGLVGYELLTKKTTQQRILPGPSLDAYHRTLNAMGPGMPFCSKRMLDEQIDSRMDAKTALAILVKAGVYAEEEGKVPIGDQEDDPERRGPKRMRLG